MMKQRMTSDRRRQLKRQARAHAAAWLQGLLDAGWPHAMRPDDDPPATPEEAAYLEAALRAIIVEVRR